MCPDSPFLGPSGKRLQTVSEICVNQSCLVMQGLQREIILDFPLQTGQPSNFTKLIQPIQISHEWFPGESNGPPPIQKLRKAINLIIMFVIREVNDLMAKINQPFCLFWHVYVTGFDGG